MIRFLEISTQKGVVEITEANYLEREKQDALTARAFFENMNYLGENGTLCAAFDFETDEKEIFDKIESEHGIKKLKLKKKDMEDLSAFQGITELKSGYYHFRIERKTKVFQMIDGSFVCIGIINSKAKTNNLLFERAVRLAQS